MTAPFEPYKIKTVEPLPLTTREQRARFLEEAHYNLFSLRAEHVTIDLLTDSGTGAMSTEQWAALMRGDESYAGARSYYRLEEVVQEITGMPYVLPTHQGRAAENLFFSAVLQPGQVVPNNTHFDTTEANVLHKGGRPLNLPCAAGNDPASRDPFKGDMDVDALARHIEDLGPARIPAVFMTVTNNSVGGQPVSMANLRAVSELCRRHAIPLYLDAARYAENCWFVQQREDGWKDRSVREIARAMFDMADGVLMSSKKDGLVNIGGFLATRDEETFRRITELMVVVEGFRTYGGLAGRDMDALAVGLLEALDESFLASRIGQVGRLASWLDEAGVPVLLPPGGHAVFLDAKAFLPAVPPHEFPGQTLSLAFYLEGGVRTVEIGSVMFGHDDPDTGAFVPAPMELVRLAVPRRVYTDNHLRYVADVAARVLEQRDAMRGYRFSYAPEKLRHFVAHFEPL